MYSSRTAPLLRITLWLRKKIKRRCREMKMGAQIRTGKRLPDTGKRFRDRIWAYAQGTQLSALSEFSISIGKSFSGADLYPHFHFQITVEPPRLIFFLIMGRGERWCEVRGVGGFTILNWRVLMICWPYKLAK